MSSSTRSRVTAMWPGSGSSSSAAIVAHASIVVRPGSTAHRIRRDGW